MSLFRKSKPMRRLSRTNRESSEWKPSKCATLGSTSWTNTSGRKKCADKDAALAAKDAEIARLREGWMRAECHKLMGYASDHATGPMPCDECDAETYCQAVLE